MFPNTSSPSTTLEGPSSPFIHFPWHDVDEELFLSQMLSQQHNNAPVTHDAPVHVSNGANLPTTAIANMISEGDSVAMKAMIPKKAKHVVIDQKEKKNKKMEIIPSSRRSGKKDRHSKICTAQGLRDRRMRLSLEIARKFFDLQDMLGFDKASKTIEWLLKNCKAAIQQLTHSHGGEKSMSFSASEESEVESEAKEMEIEQICEEEQEQEQEQEPLVGIACRKKRKRRKSCNEVGAMIITNIHVARESRDKARARARERTREKLMKGQLDQNSNTKSTESYPQISKHHHLHAAGHQDSGNNSSPQADLFEEPQASVAVMEELLGITRSSSSSTFSYNSPDFAANHNKEFPGFLAIQKGLEATIEPAPGCYTMTSIKPSLGNNYVQVQNIPNEMFRTTMNAQEYSPPDPSPTFMTISNGGQLNPSSIFVTAPAGTLDQQNPFPNSSILMTRKSNSITTPMFTATRPNNVSFQSHFQGRQFP